MAAGSEQSERAGGRELDTEHGVAVAKADPGDLCVPKTLSTSCDQAIFVDQATDTSLPSDAVVLKVDRFG